MKSFAAIVAALFVAVGAANAGEFVINPKSSDRAVALTIRGGKVVKATVIAKPEPVAKPEHPKDSGAANAGEIVINPKSSDRGVVLTIREGNVVKASVIEKPESVAKPEHLKDTAAFARTP
jgi:hypothetical protein